MKYRPPASNVWNYLFFMAYMLFTYISHIHPAIVHTAASRKKTEYILPQEGVPIMAVVLSVARATLGIRSLLGYSGEMFYRGSGMWETIYGVITAVFLVTVIFFPVYFSINIRTVYEYLDLRFQSRLVRCLASSTYVARQLCSFGITIYTPSIALSAITGIHFLYSIIFTTCICILLALIEGVRANLRAEVVQITFVMIFTISVLYVGITDCGGPGQVYLINSRHNRLNFLKAKGDVNIRVETFSAWLGQLFISLSQFGCQHNLLARYIRLKNIDQAKKAMWFMIPIIIVFFCLCWVIGVVCFATYAECDPLEMDFIDTVDQILPFFVDDRMAFVPGFIGLFMGILFNGSVIVVAVGLDPLATIIWMDFLSTVPPLKRLPDYKKRVITKSVVVVLGIAVMYIAYGISLTAGLMEAAVIAAAATTGALLGAFLMAMLFPIANWKGATAGMISSILVIVTITFGRFILQKDPNKLPTSIAGCSNYTFAHDVPTSRKLTLRRATAIEVMVATFLDWLIELLRDFTHISFMYYSFMGTMITLIVGVAVSNRTQNYFRDQYQYNLLHPTVFAISEFYYGSRPKPYYIDEPRRRSIEGEIPLAELLKFAQLKPDPADLKEGSQTKEKPKK